MRTTAIVLGLALILLANIIMVYFAPYGISPLEAFQNAGPANMPAVNAPAANTPMPNMTAMPTQNSTVPGMEANSGVEGFATFTPDLAGGAKDLYQPMGAFDGVKLSTGNSASSWRYTAPNEPLMGPEFKPGADSLFMFKNNQCKPECCGASFSCGGGCVCTTPGQRQYIASRGGNRTAPEDSA
jgi:hypothetical protein